MCLCSGLARLECRGDIIQVLMGQKLSVLFGMKYQLDIIVL